MVEEAEGDVVEGEGVPCQGAAVHSERGQTLQVEEVSCPLVEAQEASVLQGLKEGVLEGGVALHPALMAPFLA